MTEVILRGGKGLKSVFDLPVLQDGPPPGGFPSVRFGRRIPNTGPTGTAIFGVGTLVIMYGFYRVGQGNIRRRELKAEKFAARRTLVPLLQAEEDIRFAEARRKAVEREAQTMKHVHGWKAGESVYSSRQWMPPALSTKPNPSTS